MTSKDKGAPTQAAQKEAEKLEVDTGKVEGTGKDGNVTKDDVVAAASEPERVVIVKVNPDLLADQATSANGQSYTTGQEVSETLFEEVLSKDTDMEGHRLFYKQRTVK